MRNRSEPTVQWHVVSDNLILNEFYVDGSSQVVSDGSWLEDAVTDDNVSQDMLASRTCCGMHKYFCLAVIQLKPMMNF